MLIIGIDPGATGAIAFMNGGLLFHIEDMPVDEVKVGGKLRSRVSPARLARELQAVDGSLVRVFVENVNAMPRQGVAGAFTFGKAAGIIEGVLGALALPYTLITPQEWKKGVRCPTDKDAARKRACELFPAAAASFARKKDDGRAEAAMIALYGSGLPL